MARLFKKYQQWLTEISDITAKAYPKASQVQHGHNVDRLMSHYFQKANHHQNQIENIIYSRHSEKNPTADGNEHEENYEKEMTKAHEDMAKGTLKKKDPELHHHMTMANHYHDQHQRVADAHFAEPHGKASPEQMKKVADELSRVGAKPDSTSNYSLPKRGHAGYED